MDAPLSGGAPKAATGTLTMMLGGARADVAEARAAPDRAGGAPAPMLALAGEIHRLMAAAALGRADNAALMAFYDGPARSEERA